MSDKNYKEFSEYLFIMSYDLCLMLSHFKLARCIFAVLRNLVGFLLVQ